MPSIFIRSIKRAFSPQGKPQQVVSAEESLILIAAGGITALAAPGIGLWPLAWVGMIPWLLWLLRVRPSPARAFTSSGLFGFTYHLVYCVWFTGLHPMTWLGLAEWQSLAVAGMAWIAISVLGGFLTGILGTLFALLQNRLPGFLLAFLFPLLWVLGFQTFPAIELYVPWALLEYTQAGVPWALGVAATAGGGGVAYLIVLHNLLAAMMIRNGLDEPDPDWRRLVAGPGLIPLVLMIPGSSPPPGNLPMPVAIIQGNLPIETIRSGEMRFSVAEEVYLKPLQEADFPSGTLVVLPEEGIVAGWVNQKDPQANPSLARLADIARTRGWIIISGMSTYRRDSEVETPTAYNSLGIIDGSTGDIAFYNKERRVPFGEYTPNLGGLLQEGWLDSLMALAGVRYGSVFEAGAPNPPVSLGRHAAGGLVCFELIYPDLARRHKNDGADLLINSSNLGWFHGHRLLEEQFVAIGRMRAAETGLPVIISANTGVSALIDGHGRVVQRTPSMKAAMVFVEKF